MKTNPLFTTIGVAAIGLIVATGLAYATLWQWALWSMLFFIVGGMGALTVLVAVVFLLRVKISPPGKPNEFPRRLFFIGMFLLVLGAYIPITQSLRAHEVRRAREFSESLIPKLEEYRRQHNAYPAGLDLILGGDQSFPPLLQMSGDEFDNRNFYTPEETSFRFHYFEPDGFVGFQHDYCCGPGGKWTVTD